MNKCLKITITVEDISFLHEVIKPHARKMDLEGMVQPIGPVKAVIIACGKKEKVDSFVELLQKEAVKDMEIEPFIKDKDYRGVFRVIE
jgi:acylphosphatase